MASIEGCPVTINRESFRIFRQLREVSSIALLFFAAGKLGLWVGRLQAPLVFPPAGLAVAIPLVFGFRAWPGVLVGAWALGATTVRDPVVLTAMAIGNALEGMAAAWLVKRYAGGVRFYKNPVNVLKFVVLAGLLSPLLCPPFGLPDVSLRSLAFWNSDGSTLAVWWLGEATSVLVLVPLVVAWTRREGEPWDKRRVAEFAALQLLLAGVSAVVFANLSLASAQTYVLPYLCLPFTLWAAFRFGLKWTALTTFAQALVALWATLHAPGLLGQTAPNTVLLAFQGFTSFNSIMGLLVASVVWQRMRAQRALRRANAALDSKVRERTRDLLQEVQARKDAEAEILKAHDALEERVRERTADLTRANEMLGVENQRRRYAEEALSRVLERLIDAQENERQRLSRELHDQMGGQLAALKLGLQRAAEVECRVQSAECRVQSAKCRVAGQPGLREWAELVDIIIRDVHRLAWELRPPVLDDLGLGPALQRYTQEWSTRSGIVVQFYEFPCQLKLYDADPDRIGGAPSNRLPPRIEATLYRFTQEALNNVLKHARARQVSVLLDRQPRCVSLIVEDDGQGFDPVELLGSPRATDNMGLLGMQERLASVGGTLEIESAVNAGVTLYARIPLDETPTPIGSGALPANDALSNIN